MLTDYLRAAMRHAKYELLSDDASFYGEIPGFEGVYANSNALESCREQLAEVLEEWMLFRISRNLALPIVDGLKIEIKKVA
jgi:predicted RNase H-like HicB family nuclease